MADLKVLLKGREKEVLVGLEVGERLAPLEERLTLNIVELILAHVARPLWSTEISLFPNYEAF